MCTKFLTYQKNLVLQIFNFYYVPVSAVFTAVSMRPSLPPMAWKKNSLGVKPAK